MEQRTGEPRFTLKPNAKLALLDGTSSGNRIGMVAKSKVSQSLPNVKLALSRLPAPRTARSRRAPIVGEAPLEGPETDAEDPGGLSAISVRLLQGRFDQSPLGLVEVDADGDRHDALAVEGPPARISWGRSLTSIAPSPGSERTIPRITLCSSLTFPGHAYCMSRSIAAGLIPVIRCPLSSLASFRKCSARRGMSRLRWRSGGSSIVTVRRLS